MSGDDRKVTDSRNAVCFFDEEGTLHYCKTVVRKIDVIEFLPLIQ